MNVRWASDESFLVSVGGRDRCAFQWRVRPISAPPTTFYGSQPLQPLDKQGLVYRMSDGVPAPAMRQGAVAGGWPIVPAGAPAAGGVGPVVASGGVGSKQRAPLGGGGYGVRR